MTNWIGFKKKVQVFTTFSLHFESKEEKKLRAIGLILIQKWWFQILTQSIANIQIHLTNWYFFLADYVSKTYCWIWKKNVESKIMKHMTFLWIYQFKASKINQKLFRFKTVTEFVVKNTFLVIVGESLN